MIYREQIISYHEIIILRLRERHASDIVLKFHVRCTCINSCFNGVYIIFTKYFLSLAICLSFSEKFIKMLFYYVFFFSLILFRYVQLDFRNLIHFHSTFLLNGFQVHLQLLLPRIYLFIFSLFCHTTNNI